MTEQTFNILAMWTPGPLELVIILVIMVLLFGKRLPEIARGFGKSLTEFKKGVKEAKNEVTKEVDDAANAVNTDDQDAGKDAGDILRPQ
jgi:sec-independent protein translocase protein TatA